MSWKAAGPRQRQPRALIVALRKIAKDPKAKVKERLRACELQAIIAGYIAGNNTGNAAVPENGNDKVAPGRQISANTLRLRQLLDQIEAERQQKGLPDARVGSAGLDTNGDSGS